MSAMEHGTQGFALPASNPNPGVGAPPRKVVVVLGATGAGKSKLAIDLASRIPGVEIVNADSMQVYRGLDVLTNKVPLADRNGVPHHLLGYVDPSVEFTARDFRDLAVPIIDDILSRGGVPVIVGGTNYYIQALVSPFLADDLVESFEGCSLNPQQDVGFVDRVDGYERLKEIDPVAANRIHPNNRRKIDRYLSLYAAYGVPPSNLFQGKAAEKWGRVDSSRYKCCFIWVDVSLPVLDRYVEQRVDCMIEAGLLEEVCDIYQPNADYTRGLRQAIGVREFEECFGEFFSSTVAGDHCLQKIGCNHSAEASVSCLVSEVEKEPKPKLSEIFGSHGKPKILFDEAIDKMKGNTCRLIRRQIRRLNRLREDFGWDLHYIDATGALLSNLGNSWLVNVVGPSADAVKSFLFEEVGSVTAQETINISPNQSLPPKDLWAQYICQACDNQILRGAYEWEQHLRGGRHKKRALKLKKRQRSGLGDQEETAEFGKLSTTSYSQTLNI